MTQTIAAISTPIGSGGISVIRISGTDSLAVAEKLFRPYRIASLRDAIPNMMYLGTFCDGILSDKCLFVYFRAPQSFTGEDVVEFHIHGGVRLTRAVLQSVLSAGAVAARAGEFTRRAVMNGKLSLSEAEGIIDTINAKSVAELRGAYRLQSGELYRTVTTATQDILTAVCMLEVCLDTPDEFDSDNMSAVREQLFRALQIMSSLLDKAHFRGYVTDGVRIGIIGKTNRGKSSLLNAILGFDRAIVTDIAGTTRDTIEESFEYGGYRLRLIDTAGIRRTSTDAVEDIGIQRAEAVAHSADVVILVVSTTDGIDGEDIAILDTLSTANTIIAVNKTDKSSTALPSQFDGYRTVRISALHSIGIQELLDSVLELTSLNELDTGVDFVLSERHTQCIREAYEYVQGVLNNLDTTPADCNLLDLHLALQALTALSGDELGEKIADEVFSRFCVGK